MSRMSNVAKRKIETRDRTFPEASAIVYDHKKHDGFATVPKVLPLILLAMDHLSGAGPLSPVYLDLFCFVFDTKEGYLAELDPRSRAYYAGLTGQRAQYEWKKKMMELRRLGFIKTAPGTTGEMHHVLIVNPLIVMRDTIKHMPKGLDKVLAETYTNRLAEAGTDPKTLGLDAEDKTSAAGAAENAAKAFAGIPAANSTRTRRPKP